MPQPPFFETSQRTKKQFWNTTLNTKVIPITSGASMRPARKRGPSNIVEMKRFVGSLVPALIADVKLDIVAKWRRGVRIAYIAKIHQLSVQQTEAIIWCAYNEPRKAA